MPIYAKLFSAAVGLPVRNAFDPRKIQVVGPKQCRAFSLSQRFLRRKFPSLKPCFRVCLAIALLSAVSQSRALIRYAFAGGAHGLPTLRCGLARHDSAGEGGVVLPRYALVVFTPLPAHQSLVTAASHKHAHPPTRTPPARTRTRTGDDQCFGLVADFDDGAGGAWYLFRVLLARVRAPTHPVTHSLTHIHSPAILLTYI